MVNILRKLFGKEQAEEQLPSSQPAPLVEPVTKPSAVGMVTLPLTEKNISQEIVRQKAGVPTQMLVGFGQSVGRQRDHNEDAIFALNTILMSGSSTLPFGLYMVADGMGGHQHGEIASSVAIRVTASHVVRKMFQPLINVIPEPPDESLQEIMQGGVMEAHRAILKQAPGGGTTITALLIMGDQMTITHVGDSRAYLIHADGRMQVLTRDHSLVKRLEELGQLTAEEAAIYPQKNVLYRALGQGEPFEPDISSLPLPHGCHLMVCSDGLWGVVNEKDIFERIQVSPDPQIACDRLIEAANEAGGPDNISVILVRTPG